ncbi:MAG: hypothetical protein WCJ56_09250 [bacterium]
MLNTRLPGGFSWVGLVVTLVYTILLVVFIISVVKPHERNPQTTCINNQRQLAIVISGYIQEHSDTLPGVNWTSEIGAEKLDADVIYCPVVKVSFWQKKVLPVCYGYNGLLIKDDGTGVKLDSTDMAIDPSVIPLTADVEPVGTLTVPPIMYNTHGRNGAVATPVLRHKGGVVIYSFLDGHIEVSKTLLLPRGLPVVPGVGGGGK